MLFGNPPSDFGFLPSQFKSDVQMFFANTNATTQWQQWIKPRGVTMVHMLCIGGGSGGGGGQSAVANKGGGGGGAGANITSLIIPSIFLPNTLKIFVGSGGAGGAAGNNGSAGLASYVSLGTGVTNGITIPNVLVYANGSIQGGTSANPGLAGVGTGGTTVAQLGPIGKLGFFTNTGIAGTAGYLNAGAGGGGGGSNVSPTAGNITAVWNVSPHGGGTGGGGGTNSTQGNGGSIVLQAAVDFEGGSFATTIAGGIGAAGGGAPGNAGYKSLKPFLNTGGTGGGSSSVGIGGAGGPGGYGSGGGGVGAGTTGGRGGNGGDGIVIITSW